ncbi:MAG: polymerase subunit sigma-70 [Flaviaesturariibacter sp.]|nr:polymerase subunit sigma-70 [Flaviaesturariibacter sp.]
MCRLIFQTGRPLTETDLIHSLQKGEEPAFRNLVLLYQHRVYNTVLGFLQEPADAEDMTQEVFIRIFQKIGTFKGEAALATWIYRIAVTTALDALRKARRQKRGGFLAAFRGRDEPTEPPDFFHPGVAAEQKEDSVLLFKAIRRLPENQQAAFLLQKLEGLSQPEIATVLKTTVSAVESLLVRAKAGLRNQLKDIHSMNQR